MNDKFYYERKNVTTAAEVKETYMYAVNNNYKYYRAVTTNGTYFGWINEAHQKAATGQEWFENDKYKTTNLEEPITQPLTKSIDKPTIKIENNVVETYDEDNSSIALDYKDLYEKTKTELEICQNQLRLITEKLNAIENAFFVIANEIKNATSSKE